jgi:hypothetical protein
MNFGSAANSDDRATPAVALIVRIVAERSDVGLAPFGSARRPPGLLNARSALSC